MQTLSPYQIPRTGLFWLFACQILVVLPHVERLPAWMMLVAGICMLWRFMIFTGRWSYPAGWLKTLLLVLSVLAVQWSYRSLIGLDAAGCLLILAFLLKMLEMKALRDAYQLIFLSCFIVVIALLYDQSLVSTLIAFASLLVIVAAAVGLNQGNSQERPLAAFRKSLVMMMQAIPLALVLFVLVPRVPPLWSVELPSSQGVTGLSDSMSPGDIAELAQSDELVFRAYFPDEVPEKSRLYWRALNLAHFDGRRWSPAGEKGYKGQSRLDGVEDDLLSNRRVALGRTVSYRITQEASRQPWLFALDMLTLPVSGAVLTRDSRLVFPALVNQRLSYDLKSSLDYRLDLNLPGWMRELYLQLPAAKNVRSRVFAEKLFDSVGRDAEGFVNRLMQRFNQQDYYYTLKPTVLEDNTVDRFLFDSRRGFCAHYAGAMVFLSRAAGLPARVVVGYQGGEINPDTRVVQVRQFDAHAWAEIWIEGAGWVRVDPTSAVAPERIESGLQQAVAEEGSFLQDNIFSALRYQDISLLNRVRLQLDTLEYYWHQNVLNFDQYRQREFWREWLGTTNLSRIAILLSVAATFTLALLAGWGWWSQRAVTEDPVTTAYRLFCRKLQRYGVTRGVGEGPVDFMQRIQRQQPGIAQPVRSITMLYVEARYGVGRQNSGKEKAAQMRRIIRKI